MKHKKLLSILALSFLLFGCNSKTNPPDDGDSHGDDSGIVVTYMVAFDSKGGSDISAVKVKNGEKLTKPTDPTKEGYTFGGWYKDEEYTQAFNFDKDTITASIVLFAKWNINSYAVVFNSNGGSEVASVTVNYGDNLTKPTDPTKEGYTFGGWYKDEACTQAFSFVLDTIKSNITLYAKWNINTYTVIFNSNGGSSIASVSVKHGEKVTKPANPTKQGYTFVNWYKDSTLETLYDFDAEVTGNITLYAKWIEEGKTIAQYTVTFNSKGGSSVTTKTVNEGDKITKPTDPSKEGCTFGGWYKDENCTQAFDFATETITANITLYAKWNANSYTVTFNSKGGSEVASATASYGNKLTKPTDPTRDGYTFGGWYKDEACTQEFNFETETVTANITLYAKWTEEVPQRVETDDEKATVTIREMDDISSDFILGMDASCVPSLENSGVKYYDQSWNEKDVYEILADHGINYVRVRIWVDPFDSSGHGYGGGNCDLDNAIAIGKRVTAYGMKMLVDFHYSDFWCDPLKQKVPKSWADLSFSDKNTALYNYTVDSLTALKNNGVDVGMVQVGNETNAFFCGEKNNWDNICTLFNSGSKAVREVYPDALVALHFTNPEKTGRLAGYASQLSSHNVDYDVFGSSYYPYWHGTLDNLSSVLGGIATTYNKKVMVMETSYAYTSKNTDDHPNTSPTDSDTKPHEISLQGQTDQILDVIETMQNTTGGIGMCYWEGTWISVNKGSWAANSAVWEQYGSGWASSYSGEYDTDAGQYYGGCAVENQAFFSENGKMLDSLNLFKLERKAADKTEHIVNGGFKNSWTLDPWELTISSGSLATQSIVENASVSSGRAFNFWDESAFEFDLHQSISNMETGNYTLSVYFYAGCLSSAYIYVNDGTETKLALTSYGTELTKFELPVTISNSSITVGIHVNGEAGGWGHITGFSLM